MVLLTSARYQYLKAKPRGFCHCIRFCTARHCRSVRTGDRPYPNFAGIDGSSDNSGAGREHSSPPPALVLTQAPNLRRWLGRQYLATNLLDLEHCTRPCTSRGLQMRARPLRDVQLRVLLASPIIQVKMDGVAQDATSRLHCVWSDVVSLALCTSTDYNGRPLLVDRCRVRGKSQRRWALLMIHHTYSGI